MTLATEVLVFALSLRRDSARARAAAAEAGPGRAGPCSRRRCWRAGLDASAAWPARRWRVLVVAACVGYPALLFGLRALAIDDVRVVAQA